MALGIFLLGWGKIAAQIESYLVHMWCLIKKLWLVCAHIHIHLDLKYVFTVVWYSKLRFLVDQEREF